MNPNPIYLLIPEKVYESLLQFDLLNKRKVRDFKIKCYYYRYRKEGLSSGDSIDRILEEHPYLQHDTVRKIVYSVKLPQAAMAYLCDSRDNL